MAQAFVSGAFLPVSEITIGAGLTGVQPLKLRYVVTRLLDDRDVMVQSDAGPVSTLEDL